MENIHWFSRDHSTLYFMTLCSVRIGSSFKDILCFLRPKPGMGKSRRAQPPSLTS